MQREYIDIYHLKEAFRKTCDYRNFSIIKSEAINLIDEVLKNGQVQNRWLSYSMKTSYAKNTTLEEVISVMNKWINLIFS